MDILHYTQRCKITRNMPKSGRVLFKSLADDEDDPEIKKIKRKYSKEYYELNKERIIAQQVAYRQKNAEKTKEYMKEYLKEYQDKKRDELNAKRRERYKTDPNYRDYQKNYREKHKERLKGMYHDIYKKRRTSSAG